MEGDYRFALAYKQGAEKTPATVIFKNDGTRLHKLEGVYCTHIEYFWLLAVEGGGKEGNTCSTSNALGGSPRNPHSGQHLTPYHDEGGEGKGWRQKLPLSLTSWSPQEIFLGLLGDVLCVSPREQTVTVFGLSHTTERNTFGCMTFSASLQGVIAGIGNSKVLFLNNCWLGLSTPSSDTSNGAGAAGACFSLWDIRVDAFQESVRATCEIPPTAYIGFGGDSPVVADMRSYGGVFAFRPSEDGGRLRVFRVLRCSDQPYDTLCEVLSGLDLGARCRPGVDFCLTREGVLRLTAPATGSEGKRERFELVPYKKDEEVSWKEVEEEPGNDSQSLFKRTVQKLMGNFRCGP